MNCPDARTRKGETEECEWERRRALGFSAVVHTPCALGPAGEQVCPLRLIMLREVFQSACCISLSATAALWIEWLIIHILTKLRALQPCLCWISRSEVLPAREAASVWNAFGYAVCARPFPLLVPLREVLQTCLCGISRSQALAAAVDFEVPQAFPKSPLI